MMTVTAIFETNNCRTWISGQTHNVAAQLIKAKEFLKAVGTVAEKESTAYSSEEYVSYISDLNESMVEFEILEAKRASWQREVELWRTISANQRR